ncbi:hypothetical protein [Streptomyces sp. cmx-4-9]|uniref:hypothetical protein n=1 Tax=Streptomyces sp. cmx-4-9 TaxID=2790941 RepID=UPI003981779C
MSDERRVTTSADKPTIIVAIRRDIERGDRTMRFLAERHLVSRRLVRKALNSPALPPRTQLPPFEVPAKTRFGPRPTPP